MSDAHPTEADAEAEPTERGAYVESPIIMATVRVVAPFVFTFGLFIMFHGADSSGGGFQGGVIVGTVILMLGIAFGIEPTREWVDPSTLVAIVGVGTLGFVSIGVATVALGGAFLDYPAFGIHHASKYGIELVELLIGVIVAGIITGLFFAIAGGMEGGESA
ncbi:MnhB domain-containing protein [Halorussus marinus]|uniref:MnhB domain-containing protein n=1 Tax=Halorussus marinus TaxID=2505976 RepID=UPI00106DECCB|nr:MnhB domain-containing protein [Halorussus marinus]